MVEDGLELETGMRLILSRKGFDSSAGGVASPIFEDGSMLSLPIPERGSGTSYGELAWNGRSVGDVVEALTRGKRPASHHVHLDPDLIAEMRPRRRGWRASFGQCSAAQTVLLRSGVGPGDLFLFFGWFRRVREERGGLVYQRGAPDLHVLFGWLQVGEVLAPAAGKVPAWAEDHPHVVGAQRTNNALYVASEQLDPPPIRWTPGLW